MPQSEVPTRDQPQQDHLRLPVEVFIGSSSEGKTYAQFIQGVIDARGGFKARPWWCGFFKFGKGNMESLTTAVGSVDAAVFVATPDDLRMMRNRKEFVMRDNVLFEYGLFSGRLGRFRTALAIVENQNPVKREPAFPTDLLGVTQIQLHVNKKDEWEDKISQWLETLEGSRPHIYMCWESENTAKKENLFINVARESKEAKYLVLRARDLLGNQGEITQLSRSRNPALHVRMLMLNFKDLTVPQFKELTSNTSLNWGENPNLKIERRDARARLAFAEKLIKDGMSFEYRLLPANKIPEMKLRLYDNCGFFTFYKRMGMMPWHQDRTLFGIDDRVRVRPQNSPLLMSLHHMYDRLWDSVPPPKR
jgi:predicted nucleotide-binding protein